MTLEPLQQWLPAVILVAAHRLSHPDVFLPIVRAAWRLLPRVSKTVTGASVTVNLDGTKLPGIEAFIASRKLAAPKPIGVKPMSNLSLSALAPAMASAAAAVASSTQFASQLYAFGAQLVVNVENAYSAAGSGKHKRAAVLAAVGALETSLAASNPGSTSSIMSEFAPWLETVIGAYNAANAVVKPNAAPLDPIQAVDKMEAVAEKVETVATEVVNAGVALAENLFRSSPAVAPASKSAPAPVMVAINTQGI